MAPLTEPAFVRLRSVDPVLAEAAGDAAFELETLANDYVGEAMRAAFLCGLCWWSVHQQAVRQQAMHTPT